jgi:hypothetical protein
MPLRRLDAGADAEQSHPDAHNNKRKWASFISNLTIPPLIAVLMFGLINCSLLR